MEHYDMPTQTVTVHSQFVEVSIVSILVIDILNLYQTVRKIGISKQIKFGLLSYLVCTSLRVTCQVISSLCYVMCCVFFVCLSFCSLKGKKYIHLFSSTKVHSFITNQLIVEIKFGLRTFTHKRNISNILTYQTYEI